MQTAAVGWQIYERFGFEDGTRLGWSRAGRSRCFCSRFPAGHLADRFNRKKHHRLRTDSYSFSARSGLGTLSLLPRAAGRLTYAFLAMLAVARSVSIPSMRRATADGHPPRGME